MSLDPVDRAMLVTLMAAFDATHDDSAYVPISSEAKSLHLSSLGALLDADSQPVDVRVGDASRRRDHGGAGP